MNRGKFDGPPNDGDGGGGGGDSGGVCIGDGCGALGIHGFAPRVSRCWGEYDDKGVGGADCDEDGHADDDGGTFNEGCGPTG